MGRLEELAIKYSCDKYYSHSYIPVYEELFARRKVNLVLEIGIGYEDLMRPFVPKYVHGASLLMWHEFFGDINILACDIRKDTLINTERIHSIQCDQSKPKDLVKLVNFTLGYYGCNLVVIDDGSHDKNHQLITAAALLPMMSEDDIYVIEDVWGTEMEDTAERLGGYYVKGDKRPDDNMVIVEL